MALLGKGVHNLSKRRRHSERFRTLHDYPSKKRYVRAYDRFLLFFAVLAPLASIPQVAQVFFHRSVDGLSFSSWLAYALITIPWLVYGLIHREKPIIITYIMLLLLNSAIVVGIVIYG